MDDYPSMCARFVAADVAKVAVQREEQSGCGSYGLVVVARQSLIGDRIRVGTG